MTEPRIYIADLAAYSAGYLHGVWIEATDAPDDIQAQINTMLKNSPVDDAEEWALHDYEGFGNYRFSEYESIDYLHEVAFMIEQHGLMFVEVLAHVGDDMAEAVKALNEQYHGCYNSVADFAQELTEATTDIPAHLQYYIDYERMAQDMDMSGDIFTIETAHDEVHVFWNH